MYTRVVELNFINGTLEQARSTLHNHIVPSLSKQPGFLDCVLLEDTELPNRLLSITFWKSKNDADLYRREQYPMLLATISTLLHRGTPQVREFNVDTSTFHKIAAKKAA